MIYPVALDAGIPPDLFWQYTLAEVQDVILCSQRKRKRDISNQYDLAALISVYAAKLLDSKNEIQTPHPWDAYPELFAEEKQKFEIQQRVDALRAVGISRRDFACYFNQHREMQGLDKQKGGE